MKDRDVEQVPHREDYRWTLPLEVRWSDMDAMGHINNARYFTFAESARVAYFDPMMGGHRHPHTSDGGMILARVSCDFLRQLHYPAHIEVGTRVSRLGRTSVTMAQTIFNEALAVAHLQAVMVWFDYRLQKPAPVPDGVRAYIVRREGDGVGVGPRGDER